MHEFTALMAAIPNHGCSVDDFLNVSGKVSLIENGGPCSLIDRAYNAEQVPILNSFD